MNRPILGFVGTNISAVLQGPDVDEAMTLVEENEGLEEQMSSFDRRIDFFKQEIACLEQRKKNKQEYHEQNALRIQELIGKAQAEGRELLKPFWTHRVKEGSFLENFDLHGRRARRNDSGDSTCWDIEGTSGNPSGSPYWFADEGAFVVI